MSQQEETIPKEFWQPLTSSPRYFNGMMKGKFVDVSQQEETDPKDFLLSSMPNTQQNSEIIELNILNPNHSEELPGNSKKVEVNIEVKHYQCSTQTTKCPVKVAYKAHHINQVNCHMVTSADQQIKSGFDHCNNQPFRYQGNHQMDQSEQISDPTEQILLHCAKRCNIEPSFLPIFGLWDSAKQSWVNHENVACASLLMESKLEFRARFTFPNEINGKFSTDKVNRRWRNLNSLPHLSYQVVRYIYNQRREMFFNEFPCEITNEGDTSVLALLYPKNNEKLNEKMLWHEVILTLSVLDLLSREESEKKFPTLLPPKILKKYQAFYFWKRWEIQERFKQVLKRFKEKRSENMQGSDTKKFYQQQYVNYIESLMPMLMTEVFQLSNESGGTIAVNGDKGITISVQPSSLSKLLMDHQHFPTETTDEDSFGLTILKKEEIVILHLDFSSLADMTILHQTAEDMECKIFLSDVLGHQLVLSFPDRNTTNQFSSCVEGYYRLFVDSYRTPQTCTVAAQESCYQLPSPSWVSDTSRASEFSYENSRHDRSSFLHGPVASGFLRQKLAASAEPYASVFRRSPKKFDEYDLLIKLTKDNRDVEFQLSTIRRDKDNYLLLEGLGPEKHFPKQRSIHHFIKFLSTLDGLKKGFCKALKNIIPPLPEAISQEKVNPKREVTVPASDIAKVKDILNGKFSRTLICRYEKGGTCVPFAASESVTCKDPMERQHSCQSLSNSKNMMQQLRHHEHINKVIGTTPGGEYVWEYSAYGNITDYLQDLEKVNSVDQKITGYWLLQVYYQIASAFSYMESRNIAHGHLCGSTIVLFQVSPIPFIKINHSGISSFVSGINGSEVIEAPTLKAPWIGIEYCRLREIINTKYVPTVNGDKWSFATTVCEINRVASSGKQIENTEWANKIAGTEMETRYLEYSSILSPPDWLRAPGSTIPAIQKSGAVMESLLKRCWNSNPNERPLFSDIRRTLATLVHYGVGQQEAFEPDIEERENPFLGLDLPSYKDIELIRQRDLGNGNFGEVTCNWDCETRKLVAVKTMLKQYDMHDRVAFEREFRIMTKITHKNIVKILGIAYPSVRIVLEYLSAGSLLELVSKNRTRRNHPDVHPDRLQKYACDIAQPIAPAFHREIFAILNKCREIMICYFQDCLLEFCNDSFWGMNALHKKKIVHRDLALRNVLLAREDDTYVAKISDFGLARSVEKNCDYYRNYSDGPLPIWWYAPECLTIESPTRYCFQSDVWSYGVTIWQLYNFGKGPYPPPLRGNQNHAAGLFRILKSGYRLEQQDCPEEMYQNLVKKCWKFEPSKRISFSEIVQYINQKL